MSKFQNSAPSSCSQGDVAVGLAIRVAQEFEDPTSCRQRLIMLFVQQNSGSEPWPSAPLIKLGRARSVRLEMQLSAATHDRYDAREAREQELFPKENRPH